MNNRQEITDSSTVKAIEFDSDTCQLTIEFIAGSRYTYADVPAATLNDFFEAKSKGKYFSQHIKDKFLTEKVGDTKVTHAFAIGDKPL